jgi:hypothetical protein
MSAVGILFFVVVATALLTIRREYAPIPLLIGCCYMTMGQGIELGPFSLPTYRMLLLVGLVRVVARGERLVGGLNGVDRLVIFLMVWLLFASLFHERIPGAGPIYMSGIVFNISLVYFLVRVWCGNAEDISNVIAAVGLVLAPVAVGMFYEQAAGYNMFSSLGGIGESVSERNGRLRAQGPFRHAILAGTVGAACFPLMLGIWKRNRIPAMVGAASTVTMVFASASSGPLVSLFMSGAVVLCWRFRQYSRLAVWAGVAGYLLIEVISNRPAYHAIVTRLDFTGSSTAYYRARLIDTTIRHFSEWWLIGTDYTRHWIPSGIGSIIGDGRHMDITNYYITFGLWGGILALVLVVVIIFKCLGGVIRQVEQESVSGSDGLFTIWCLGASLFSHAMSSLSISYFDQSQTLFWLTVAALTSLLSVRERSAATETEVYDEVQAVPSFENPAFPGIWSSDESRS